MNNRRPRFLRDEIFMLVGICLFGLGALLVLGFMVSDKSGGEGYVGALIFTFMLLVGGAVVFRVGLGFRRMEKRLGRLLDVLRTVDRSSVRSIARTANVPEAEARKGVLFLIGRGFVSLRFDPGEDLVFSPRSSRGGWLKLPSLCPNCNAPCPTMVPAGSSPSCEYCGTLLPVEELSRERATAWKQKPWPGGDQPSLNQTAFSGSWLVLIVLFIVFWPIGVAYLIKGLKKHGGHDVFQA